MAPRFQFAKRKAEECLQAAGIYRAPVALEKIAKMHKADVRYEPFSGELSGMILRAPEGDCVIGINSKHPKTRQRFSLAHELAHLVLHKSEELHLDDRALLAFRNHQSGLAIDDKEIEANQFAASLLMPEHFLREDIAKLSPTAPAEDVIDQLAKSYQVSVQAMSIRLARLSMLT